VRASFGRQNTKSLLDGGQVPLERLSLLPVHSSPYVPSVPPLPPTAPRTNGSPLRTFPPSHASPLPAPLRSLPAPLRLHPSSLRPPRRPKNRPLLPPGEGRVRACASRFVPHVPSVPSVPPLPAPLLPTPYSSLRTPYLPCSHPSPLLAARPRAAFRLHRPRIGGTNVCPLPSPLRHFSPAQAIVLLGAIPRRSLPAILEITATCKSVAKRFDVVEVNPPPWSHAPCVPSRDELLGFT
jgi:hypothetical protein